MNPRDANYALLAALGLTLMVALWALANPETVADPGRPDRADAPGPALPIPTRLETPEPVRERAFSVLVSRDLFVAPNPGNRRFATAKIDRPVSLNPVRAERPPRQAVPRPVPLAAPRNAPAPLADAPARQPLLRDEAQPIQSQPPQQRPAAPAPAWEQPRLAARTVPPAQNPQMRLRGVFPDPLNGGQALLAMPDGGIVSVGLGSVVLGWQVVRIGPASISLSARGGQQVTLRMPGY